MAVYSPEKISFLSEKTPNDKVDKTSLTGSSSLQMYQNPFDEYSYSKGDKCSRQGPNFWIITRKKLYSSISIHSDPIKFRMDKTQWSSGSSEGNRV